MAVESSTLATPCDTCIKSWTQTQHVWIARLERRYCEIASLRHAGPVSATAARNMLTGVLHEATECSFHEADNTLVDFVAQLRGGDPEKEQIR